MPQAAKDAATIVPGLILPPTSARPVSLVATERALGIAAPDILAATAAPLILPETIPEMTP